MTGKTNFTDARNPMRIAAITGHRPKKLFGYDLMRPEYTAIRRSIRAILERERTEVLYTGMALGTDMLAALAAIDMQDDGSDIKLRAAIPFRGHNNPKWPSQTRNLYDAILYRCESADLVTQGGYSRYALNKRNEYMCDRCDYLIAVSTGAPGGTADCIAYARKLGRPVWHIDPRHPEIPLFERGR